MQSHWHLAGETLETRVRNGWRKTVRGKALYFCKQNCMISSRSSLYPTTDIVGLRWEGDPKLCAVVASGGFLRRHVEPEPILSEGEILLNINQLDGYFNPNQLFVMESSHNQRQWFLWIIKDWPSFLLSCAMMSIFGSARRETYEFRKQCFTHVQCSQVTLNIKPKTRDNKVTPGNTS